jgi:hypothetical protein
VIQRDGQFRFAQTGADEQSKFAGDAARLGDGFAPDGIHDRLVGQSDVLDNEAAMKPEVFELPEVNHGEIQTPFAPIVHPKMNSGNEFPSAYAALRRDKLPMRNSECRGSQREAAQTFPSPE